jgi:hypothetical protein
MTKDELIALADQGKATIQVAYTITRYAITRNGIDDSGERPNDYAAIFLSISGEDGGVYDDKAYFTDEDDEIDLTETEVERLRLAIRAQLSKGA